MAQQQGPAGAATGLGGLAASLSMETEVLCPPQGQNGKNKRTSFAKMA
jgi:hypothetical protein